MTVPVARILVCDDDPLERAAAVRLLQSANYQVFSAENGEQTLRLAADLRPDLILLDVALPDIDGVEACSRLKADSNLADIFVILFSGARTGSEDQSHAMEQGADGYIVRPVSNRELLARVQAYLRVRAAEQFSRQKAREWQTTFDAISDPVYLIDSERRIVRANQAARRLFGGTFQELIGTRCCEAICDKAELLAACPFERAQQQGGRQVSEMTLRGAIYQISSDPIFDEQGNLVGAANALRDVTLQRRAEDSLRQMNAELERRVQQRAAEIEAVRRRLELAAEIGGVGVWEMDAEMQAVWWDERMYKLYAANPETFVPTFSSWSALIHPEDEPLIRQKRQNAMEKGERYDAQYRVFRLDGEMRYFVSRAMPVPKPQGGLTLLGVNIDVTPLKKSELELIKSRDALSAANAALEKAARSKDEFLASMSHELRTPLTGILGFAQSLQLETYGALNEKQRKAAQTIEAAGSHLLELINDILDLSKITSGKTQLQIAPCSLAEVCFASVQMARGMAEQKRQVIHYAPPEQTPTIHADARRLKQILVNLLSNAVKFTREGGELGLDIQTDEAAGLVRMSVWDGGVGIKTEDMDKLFKPFVQIDAGLDREYAGAGLGLSLVLKLTEMHNGGVEVESEFGRGSRFTVILPWTRDGSLSSCDAASARQTSFFKNGAPQLTTLIADKSEEVLSHMADYLRGAGCYVLKARGASELLEHAKEFQPDLILADISMPGMEDLNVFRRLRETLQKRARPAWIVALSTAVKPGDREKFLRAGADAFIGKPLTPFKLQETLQKYAEEK